MMAICKNVQTYAAAQCFYWVGFDGILYVMDVIIADTSNLKDRAFWFAYSTSPYIVTIWVAPQAASAFVKHSSFRWAYWAWFIITPVICTPLIGTLFYQQWKASKRGVLRGNGSGRTTGGLIKHVLIEGDSKFLIFLCYLPLFS